MYVRILLLVLQINKIEEAIEDCSKAVELDLTYTKAYLKRANLYVEQQLLMFVVFPLGIQIHLIVVVHC